MPIVARKNDMAGPRSVSVARTARKLGERRSTSLRCAHASTFVHVSSITPACTQLPGSAATAAPPTARCMAQRSARWTASAATAKKFCSQEVSAERSTVNERVQGTLNSLRMLHTRQTSRARAPKPKGPRHSFHRQPRRTHRRPQASTGKHRQAQAATGSGTGTGTGSHRQPQATTGGGPGPGTCIPRRAQAATGGHRQAQSGSVRPSQAQSGPVKPSQAQSMPRRA
jgi:hypothetical protein